VIGVLPTYETLGVWAAILLVACRLIQGFGLGGEWGGAVLMAVEHAPDNRKGFYGSWPQLGAPLGAVPDQRGDDREQCPALVGQVVLIPGRVLGVGAPLEHAVVGELVQPGGQHAAGQAQAVFEVVEPACAAEGVTQDQQRPPLADHVEGLGDRAVPVGEAGQAHRPIPS